VITVHLMHSFITWTNWDMHDL